MADDDLTRQEILAIIGEQQLMLASQAKVIGRLRAQLATGPDDAPPSPATEPPA